MKTIIIILVIGSLFSMLRALVLSYIHMGKGGTILTMLRRMHWINYVPVINFVFLCVYWCMKVLHTRIK